MLAIPMETIEELRAGSSMATWGLSPATISACESVCPTRVVAAVHSRLRSDHVVVSVARFEERASLSGLEASLTSLRASAFGGLRIQPAIGPFLRWTGAHGTLCAAHDLGTWLSVCARDDVTRIRRTGSGVRAPNSRDETGPQLGMSGQPAPLTPSVLQCAHGSRIPGCRRPVRHDHPPIDLSRRAGA